ncbi:MAG: glycosyltransferase family 2 protein [Planctomycetaceae bacterium]
MSTLNFIVCEMFPWGVVGLWTVYVALLVSGLRKRQVLKAETDIKLPRSIPRVTLLVAARNEEDCIEKCLQTLLMQDYPNMEIIAINDRSTDATGEIMNRLESEHLGLLRVVHVDNLPTGWFGKTHALHCGTSFATGDWLCYIDADCELLSPRTVSLAVQEAQTRCVDLLSLTPRFILDRLWEKITVPVCSSLMVIWFQPSRVNNPRLSTSYANGAFLMMTRHCLDRLGGWCRFRTQISEDIAIAREVKSSGMRLAVLENDGLYRTQMYETIRSSWNGWSRIFYGALPRQAIAISLARLILCSIIPTWAVLAWFATTGFAAQNGTISYGMAALISAVVLQQVYSALIFRAVGGRILWSLTAPLGHIVLAGMLGRALLNHFGLATTQWSGSVFRRGQLMSQQSLPSPHVFKQTSIAYQKK